jgi:aryl-alcohol dehydrogenase-like predicted oxidoreductase
MQSLVLGTANFGNDYGIQKQKILSTREIDEILEWSVGKIGEIDTAEDYPGSHKLISNHSNKFKITTKINLNRVNYLEELKLKVNEVQHELGEGRIHRILFRPHQNNNNFTCEAIKIMEELKISGAISEIGLSIYETTELDYFNESVDTPLVFQVPLNLLNRNFQERVEGDKETFGKHMFYARSIFLQGLILMNPKLLPSNLRDATGALQIMNKELSRFGLSPIEATIAFIKNQKWLDGVIIGVSSIDELKRNYDFFKKDLSPDWGFLQRLSGFPSKILDPRLW